MPFKGLEILQSLVSDLQSVTSRLMDPNLPNTEIKYLSELMRDLITQISEIDLST
jgi:hypothetical protein